MARQQACVGGRKCHALWLQEPLKLETRLSTTTDPHRDTVRAPLCCACVSLRERKEREGKGREGKGGEGKKRRKEKKKERKGACVCCVQLYLILVDGPVTLSLAAASTRRPLQPLRE